MNKDSKVSFTESKLNIGRKLKNTLFIFEPKKLEKG